MSNPKTLSDIENCIVRPKKITMEQAMHFRNRGTTSYIMQPKLDGVRMLAHITSENDEENREEGRGITLRTRQGKYVFLGQERGRIYEQITETARLLHLHQAVYCNNDIILDGELIADHFTEIQGFVARKDSDKSLPQLKYRVFHIHVVEAESEKLHSSKKRYDIFKDLSYNYGDECSLVACEEIGDKPFPSGLAEEWCADHEGFVVKELNVDQPEKWFKYKPVKTCDLNLVDFVEGTGRLTGSLGAIRCKGLVMDKEVEVSVGSGLTDAMRDQIWKIRDKIMAQKPKSAGYSTVIISLEYDCMTLKGKTGTYSFAEKQTWSLRFPRFKGLRVRSEEMELSFSSE